MPDRKKMEKYVIDLMNEMDPSGKSVKHWTEVFKKMSDKDFFAWVKKIERGEAQLTMYRKNMDKALNMNQLLDLAKKRGVKLFQKYVTVDRDTGRPYTSAKDAMLLDLPVRRLSQYLAHKRSLPDGDQHINPISGQVIPPDKGAKLTGVELQILASKSGLNPAILELAKIRGGDTTAYADAKNQIEETGEVSMNDIDMSGRPRSAITAGIYLRCAGIDNNL